MTANEVWSAIVATMDPELRAEFAGDEVWAIPLIEGALKAREKARAAEFASKVEVIGRSPAVVAAVKAKIDKELMGEPAREYRYGCVNRPPGYATVPKGYVRIDPSTDKRYRHGIVVYDRPLTEAEIKSYELVQFYTPQQVSDLADRVAAEYDDYPLADLEGIAQDGTDDFRAMVLGQVNTIDRNADFGSRSAFVALVLDRTRQRHGQRTEAQAKQSVPDKFFVTTGSGKRLPVWLIDSFTYRSIMGIEVPGIFLDCSPYQYSRMSKRGQSQYRESQRELRSRSSSGIQRWRDLVWEAFQAGYFDLTTPGIRNNAGMFSDNAFSVVLGNQIDQNERQKKVFGAKIAVNNAKTSDVAVGEVVYSGLSYGVVLRKYEQSVKLRVHGYVGKLYERTTPYCHLQWLEFNDREEIQKERPDLAGDDVTSAQVVQALRDRAFDKGVKIGLILKEAEHPAPEARKAITPKQEKAGETTGEAPFTFNVKPSPVTIVRWVTEASVDDYPYGRERTTARWYIERALKGTYKGMVRVCKVTEDPRTGRWNTPHCETYVDDVRLGVTEAGRVYWVYTHRDRIQFHRGDGAWQGAWSTITSDGREEHARIRVGMGFA